MKKYFLLTFTLAMFTMSGMTQKLPDWVTNKPTPTNSTYLYVVGAIMLPVGALFAGIGYLVSHIDSSSPQDREAGEILEKVGIGFSALGGVCLTIGSIRRASGKAKIRKAVNLYNNGRMYSQNGLEMEYGLAGSNVYLTFRF